jgi:two-component system sensor histidine kinase KdpD
MTRLESGILSLQRDWHPIEEVVGAALTRLKRVLADRPLVIEIPDDLPLVSIDDVLIEQVLVNLIENAAKYTPEGSPVEIRAEIQSGFLHIVVADRGAGIPAGSEESIFAKFSRTEERSAREGVGLGLAICKGFVEAHDGWIRAENRSGGGAVFRFALPLDKGSKPAPMIAEEMEG